MLQRFVRQLSISLIPQTLNYTKPSHISTTTIFSNLNKFSTKTNNSSPGNSFSTETSNHDNLPSQVDDDDDVTNEELKKRIQKFYEGDEEAIPSIFEAILKRKLAGKHDESDNELLEEFGIKSPDDKDFDSE